MVCASPGHRLLSVCVRLLVNGIAKSAVTVLVVVPFGLGSMGYGGLQRGLSVSGYLLSWWRTCVQFPASA